MDVSHPRKQHPQTPLQVAAKVWVGMRPWIGEDMASDRDETLGCGDETPCCTYKGVEVECVPMMVDGSTGGEGGRLDVSTPIPPLGPSPCRPLGMTVGVLPRKKNFPTHGP